MCRRVSGDTINNGGKITPKKGDGQGMINVSRRKHIDN